MGLIIFLTTWVAEHHVSGTIEILVRCKKELHTLMYCVPGS